MEFKKNFSENWIVLLGIALLFIAFFKYKNNENFAKTKIKEIIPTQIAQIDLNNKRNTASEKKVTSTAQKSPDTVVEFTNSSERFKQALANKNEFSRKPAQLNTKIFLAEHSILQSTRWKIWLNTQVVKKDDAPQGSSLANVSNFSIIESEDSIDLSEFDTNKAIAVFDERLKKPGLITGTLKIQTSDKLRLLADLKKFEAQISDEFENIETYFIRSTQPVFNLELLYQNLKNQEYIKNVELEILSKSYDKN